MIKIYNKAFPLSHPEEVEKEIQLYINNGYEILSTASELHGEFGHIMAVMKWDEAKAGIFNPWVGCTVRCGNELYKVVTCSPDPYIIFDDGTKHYAMTIEPIEGDLSYWIAVNDAQVELVEDKK